LRGADVIFVPATRPDSSYARAIVETYIDPGRQAVVELVCPAYHDRAEVGARWVELAEVVCDQIAVGTSGAFICEGDPSLYSTWLHLRAGMQQLATGVTLITVPGVSSVSAAAALADMPLAAWDERLLVMPAVYSPTGLGAALDAAETVVLLKAGGDLERLTDSLTALQYPVRVAMVRRAGRPEECVIRELDAMRAAAGDYFTTVLVRRTDS
jgi:precorrin-2/cobalt-factor-2 C20-methyltransferase